MRVEIYERPDGTVTDVSQDGSYVGYATAPISERDALSALLAERLDWATFEARWVPSHHVWRWANRYRGSLAAPQP